MMPSPKKEKVPMRANPEDETKVSIKKKLSPKQEVKQEAFIEESLGLKQKWKPEPWTLVLGMVVGFGCGYASVLIVEFVIRRSMGV